MKWKNIFSKIDKDFFTPTDVVRITGYAPATVYLLLNRMVKGDELIRLARGYYCRPEKIGSIDIIANQIYFPSYLSFESALSRYGVLSQIPYQFTFSTPLKTKKMIMASYSVIFRQIQAQLFFGFSSLRNGLWCATPEKALFDLVYFNLLGKEKTDFKRLDLAKIDQKRFFKLLEQYLPGGKKYFLN